MRGIIDYIRAGDIITLVESDWEKAPAAKAQHLRFGLAADTAAKNVVRLHDGVVIAAEGADHDYAVYDVCHDVKTTEGSSLTVQASEFLRIGASRRAGLPHWLDVFLRLPEHGEHGGIKFLGFVDAAQFALHEWNKGGFDDTWFLRIEQVTSNLQLLEQA